MHHGIGQSAADMLQHQSPLWWTGSIKDICLLIAFTNNIYLKISIISCWKMSQNLCPSSLIIIKISALCYQNLCPQQNILKYLFPSMVELGGLNHCKRLELPMIVSWSSNAMSKQM